MALAIAFTSIVANSVVTLIQIESNLIFIPTRCQFQITHWQSVITKTLLNFHFEYQNLCDIQQLFVVLIFFSHEQRESVTPLGFIIIHWTVPHQIDTVKPERVVSDTNSITDNDNVTLS